MKSKRNFIDCPSLIREPLSEKEKSLVEGAMKQVSTLSKKYNVKIQLLESPHNEENFSDDLTNEELKTSLEYLKELLNKK